MRIKATDEAATSIIDATPTDLAEVASPQMPQVALEVIVQEASDVMSLLLKR